MVEPTDDGAPEGVLEYLRDARLFDFTGYKRGALSRRIARRMEQVGTGDYEQYVDYLEVHPEEFEQLFNTILINVSAFFRDPEAWQVLRETVIPEIVARHPADPIRVWSAGCAGGQEAYSVVMAFAEEMGPEACRARLKVYATDLDSDALEQARQAEYSPREVDGIPPDLLAHYFRATGGNFTFSGEMRRSLIFGRHDLLKDAPISRTDLLICRNTLMYFNSDVQAQLINRLHFSVADRGFLFLGKVEMLNRGDLFQAVDARHRIFRTVNAAPLRDRPPAMDARAPVAAGNGQRIVDSAFDSGPNPEIILDGAGNVLSVNSRARELFAVGADAIGRPFQDLELSYRPVELRSRIDQVRAEGVTVALDDVSRWTPGGDLTFLDIKLIPLVADGEHLGVLITFADVTRHRHLQQELERTHRELEVAFEELQSANEELETTNEALQSTVEELETTNEELQSTNEELETMNEELAATNEELAAINDELGNRTAEVVRANSYLESVLSVLNASVVVVDDAMQVRVWNGLSFEMWGLRAEEVEGRNVSSLDFGFPVEVLMAPIRDTLQSGHKREPFEVDAVSRRGNAIRFRVQVAPLHGAGRSIEGAIVLFTEAGGK